MLASILRFAVRDRFFADQYLLEDVRIKSRQSPMGALSCTVVPHLLAHSFVFWARSLTHFLFQKRLEHIWKGLCKLSIGAVSGAAHPRAAIEFVCVLSIGLFAFLIWFLAAIQVSLI